MWFIYPYSSGLFPCHLDDWKHDDVIKWKHYPRYWSFVRGIHRSPVNSPDKGQWRGALVFSLICVWINAWVNNRKAGDLRRHRAHNDIIMYRTTTKHNKARTMCIYYGGTTPLHFRNRFDPLVSKMFSKIWNTANPREGWRYKTLIWLWCFYKPTNYEWM